MTLGDVDQDRQGSQTAHKLFKEVGAVPKVEHMEGLLRELDEEAPAEWGFLSELQSRQPYPGRFKSAKRLSARARRLLDPDNFPRLRIPVQRQRDVGKVRDCDLVVFTGGQLIDSAQSRDVAVFHAVQSVA